MRFHLSILLPFFLLPSCLFAQTWYPESFIQTQARLSKDGAIGLCSWSVMNLGYSGYQYGRTTGETQQFHKMNIAWSGVNLAVGVPSLIRSYRVYKGKKSIDLGNYDPQRYMRVHSLQGWIDVACVATGIIIVSKADSSNDPATMRGFGNSILLQAGFRFTFDSAMYLLHRKLLRNYEKMQSQGEKNF